MINKILTFLSNEFPGRNGSDIFEYFISLENNF